MEEGASLSAGASQNGAGWVDRLPPDVLAYVGDAVYELYVRTMVAPEGGRLHRLHRRSVQHVRAAAQAAALRAILPALSEAEQEIVRRGRNAKGQAPRGASPADYRLSTAFEALLGYLYLAGETDRLVELLRRAFAAGDSAAEP